VNVPQCLISAFQSLQKAEEHVRELATVAANADAMDIDVSELRTDYKILAKAATSLFWEIS
jgi:hypothetical protein